MSCWTEPRATESHTLSIRGLLFLPIATLAHADEPVTQPIGSGCLLPAAVRTDGQAQSQHRRRPQVGAHGVLHAHSLRNLRRPGAAALRRTTATTEYRRPEAPRRHAWIRTHTDHSRRMTTDTVRFCFLRGSRRLWEIDGQAKRG